MELKIQMEVYYNFIITTVTWSEELDKVDFIGADHQIKETLRYDTYQNIDLIHRMERPAAPRIKDHNPFRKQ